MEKYIYKIINLSNGKIYIGQTNNLERRIEEHKGRNRDTPIHNAIVKYGWENFSVDILYYGENYNEEEKKWIKYYDSQNKDKGYNIVEGGQDSSGEANPAAKLTQEQVDTVKHLLIETDLTHEEISKITGVNAWNVASINNGCSWIDKNQTYPLRCSKIPEEKVDKIIDLLKNTDLSSIKIGEITGISSSIVRLINVGKEHKRNCITYPIRRTEKSKYEEVVKLLLETDLSYKEISEQVCISTGTISLINLGKTRHDNTLNYPLRKDTKIYGIRQTASGNWNARIKIKNKEINLGTYKTKKEAENARLEAEHKKNMGEKIEKK